MRRNNCRTLFLVATNIIISSRITRFTLCHTDYCLTDLLELDEGWFEANNCNLHLFYLNLIEIYLKHVVYFFLTSAHPSTVTVISTECICTSLSDVTSTGAAGRVAAECDMLDWAWCSSEPDSFLYHALLITRSTFRYISV